MRNKEYAWYMLTNANGFGTKSIHYINNTLRKNGLSIIDLFDLGQIHLDNLFPEIGKGKFSKTNLKQLNELDNNKLFYEFEKLKNDNVHLIGLDDDRYPKAILDIMQENAPPVLYCKGYLPLLNTQGVSIVGSRDVDDFGILAAKSIASKLAEEGFNVTSGYAKGIDTAAHIGALQAKGTTTMILSFGINHSSIKKEIKELDWEKNTLFVSQFYPYEKFTGKNAMTRNKLVCAMSKAIVVIASGPERDIEGRMSGTFDAGKSALEMKIPLFVLNPNLLKNTPIGNSDLIRLGAIEFSNGEEITASLTQSLKFPILGQTKLFS